MVGKSVSSGLLSWRGADLTTNVYIGNIDIDASVEEIRAGISNQDVKVVDLEELKRTHNRFKSLRLCIRKADRSKIAVPEFWPDGVVVRNFFWGKDARADANRVTGQPSS